MFWTQIAQKRRCVQLSDKHRSAQCLGGGFLCNCAVDCSLLWPRKRCRPARVPSLSTVFRATSGGVEALATEVWPRCLVSHAVFRYDRDARER
jgi:hypothetical protein